MEVRTAVFLDEKFDSVPLFRCRRVANLLAGGHKYRLEDARRLGDHALQMLFGE
jgi:hypothetical protein